MDDSWCLKCKKQTGHVPESIKIFRDDAKNVYRMKSVCPVCERGKSLFLNREKGTKLASKYGLSY